MTAYTVQGHPLNVYQALAADDAELTHAQLQNSGIGASITITLSGGSDTKAKAHGCLK